MNRDASLEPSGRDPEADLRVAHEALTRRVVQERVAFADRVQDVLDHAQHLQSVVDEREGQIRDLREQREQVREEVQALRQNAEALQERIRTLHQEVIDAHDNHRALLESRSYRYTQPLRDAAKAIRRR